MALGVQPSSDTPSPVIALDRATKRYGDFAAVDEVSFDVARGEFFSMLGPSGCGKTTLLRLIAGFESVSSGRILLEGRDVTGVPPYRRNVNTVFQHYALFPHLSVRDNVAFGPRTQRLPRAQVEQRVAHVLDVVRLSDLADRRPHQLSGGQQQRVALARALANSPSALLLDEPLSALDRQLRQAMQIELKRIQREVGITFLFVTHDQEEALTLSDRIAVMSAGRIKQVGTAEAIYDSPATTFVAGFIGTANLLPVTVVRTDGDRTVVQLAAGATAEVPAAGRRFAPGERATLMVRPERVRVSAAAPAGDPGLAATVVESAFQGALVRIVLVAADGRELVAHASHADRDGRAHAAPGTRAFASWASEAARLLPAAAE